MAVIPSVDECNPGMAATGFCVLVALQEQEDKVGSVYLPDKAIEKNTVVEQRGRVVSVGPVAFDFADFPAGAAPKVGDAVLFAKLAGVQVDGDDRRKYRLLQDRDICAILDRKEAA